MQRDHVAEIIDDIKSLQRRLMQMDDADYWELRRRICSGGEYRPNRHRFPMMLMTAADLDCEGR